MKEHSYKRQIGFFGHEMREGHWRTAACLERSRVDETEADQEK